MGVERRVTLGFTADQLTAQSFAATQGCVYDLVHNVECCQAGQPAAAIVAAGQAAIEAAIANCGKSAPAAAAAPAPSAPSPVVLQSAIQPAPSSPAPSAPPAGQASQPTSRTVTVQTPSGSLQVPVSMVPGVSDLSLTPAEIRVPNIWDSLDPSKLSQFEYRGLSTSIPVFFSPQYRAALMARGGASGAAGASAAMASTIAASGAGGDTGGLPWWVWLAIGGTAWMLRDKNSRAPRAPRPRKKVAA